MATHLEAEVTRLLGQAALLAAARHTERAEAAQTRAQLNAHGLDDAEIERQLASLKFNSAPNKTAAITTYSYLHGLQHLDRINSGRPAAANGAAAAIIALYQSAEICLGTIGALSSRMLVNLREDQIGEALAKAQWRSGFQQLLYRLGLLLVEMNGGGETGGAVLRLDDSRIYREYREQNRQLRQWLMQSSPEEAGAIFGKGLDDPRRNIFFHEFVNTGEEQVWASLFACVQLPGLSRPAEEDQGDFYARLIGSEQIAQMLQAMETEADTALLPFRAVHQVTEVVAGVANTLACEAAAGLLTATADAELTPGLRGLTMANRLLMVADESIKLMQRSLTPNAYSAVRPNLGMVRGTSSVVLRKTLFNSTYPLLVRACKLRLMDFSSERADDEGAVEERAGEVLRGGSGDVLPGVLRQIVILHQHVRTWRDNHIQLPKTHLGVSGAEDRPTVSLSGSDSAVGIAHELRKTHATDPIIPLYRALLGTPPPAVHEVLASGEFDEYMARATAREVLDVYSEVQERFYRRCPFAASNGKPR